MDRQTDGQTDGQRDRLIIMKNLRKKRLKGYPIITDRQCVLLCVFTWRQVLAVSRWVDQHVCVKCGVKPLISTVRNKRPTDKEFHLCFDHSSILYRSDSNTWKTFPNFWRPCRRWKCTTLRLYWDKQVYKARAAWVRSQPCVNQGYLRRHKTAEDDTVSDGVSHESRERRSERPDHSYQKQTLVLSTSSTHRDTMSTSALTKAVHAG